MRINYGIWRKVKGKPSDFENHKIYRKRFPTTQEMLAVVAKKHAGWILSGWCEAKKKP